MKAASLLTLMAAVSFGASAMTLNSSDIQEGSRMAETFAFNGMGCNGENQTPLCFKNYLKSMCCVMCITIFHYCIITQSSLLAHLDTDLSWH